MRLRHPHFSLKVFAIVGESLEKRACARDSRSRMEPENASGGAIRRNPPKPIRARFRWFHLQASRHKLSHIAARDPTIPSCTIV